MKSNKVNYTVVGAFVLVMLVGLVVFVAKLSAWSGATDKYYAIYNNVTGVKFGSQVLYEGYAIGQVEKVSPKPTKTGMVFKVDFSVQKNWRIPSNSVSEIAKPGLLSAITLSIRAGDSDTAYKPGDEIKGKEAADLFAVVSSVAGQVTELTEQSLKPLLESVRKTTETFGRLMEGEAETLMKKLNDMALDMSERLPLIADNIQQFSLKMNRSSDELNAVLSPENREIINKMLKNMAAATTNFVTLLGDLDTSREKLDALLANMDATAGDVNSLVNDNKPAIKNTLADLRHIVGSVARHVDSVNKNMEGAARNMHEFSRQIRQNPGLLLGGSPPKDEAPGK